MSRRYRTFADVAASRSNEAPIRGPEWSAAGVVRTSNKCDARDTSEELQGLQKHFNKIYDNFKKGADEECIADTVSASNMKRRLFGWMKGSRRSIGSQSSLEELNASVELSSLSTPKKSPFFGSGAFDFLTDQERRR